MLNTDKPARELFNSERAKPDYENDLYFVSKRGDYCKEHFKYFIKSAPKLFEAKTLFIDYSPNNALRQELSKRFRLVSPDIYATSISKKLIEKRKVVEADDRT